jgi:hypothetical protein
MPSISRRAFLAGAVGAVGAAACSSGKSRAAGSVISVAPKTGGANQLNLLVTTALIVSGVDQRVGFVLMGQQDFVVPSGPVTLQFGLDVKHLGPPSPATVHNDAGPAPAYLTIVGRFPNPGSYWARVSYQGKTADAPIQVVAPAATKIPIAGRPMISVPTPTVVDHRGLNPICTRSPACPWHTISLDDALAAHKPIALLFATPALCQTATCGPVLDQLLTFKTTYESDVTFIHSEIYTDLTAKANAPAVLAYHLDSEPMLFVAGADGVVQTRIDGLFGHAEALAALAQVTT